MWREHPVTVEEAQKLLLEMDWLKEPLETERVSLLDSLGRVCAQDICAEWNQPPFASSPLDGYAVRSRDTMDASDERPAMLRVTGCIYAGMWPERAISPGEAARIMTGAPLPAGADCVVMQEETRESDGSVYVRRPIARWENYCRPGERLSKGERLLSRGDVIGASMIGALASQGSETVAVYRRPAAGVMATGDELLPPGVPRFGGRIYDGNGPRLTARMRELGIDAAWLLPVPDRLPLLTEAIREELRQRDFLITTGGVSVGLRDLLPAVADALGARCLFHGSTAKPGAPTLAMLWDGKPVFCLSGNPWAASVAFELLVRPVLERRRGRGSWTHQKGEAALADSFLRSSPVRRFLRGYQEKDSIRLARNEAERCNCLVDVPEGAAGLPAGERVTVWML